MSSPLPPQTTAGPGSVSQASTGTGPQSQPSGAAGAGQQHVSGGVQGLQSVGSPGGTSTSAPTSKTWTELIKINFNWVATALGVVIAAIALIALRPTFQSVWIGQRGLRAGDEANKLAEWSALLAFKQDCEARQATSRPMAANCSEVIAMIMPAPPYGYTFGQAIRRLVRRVIPTDQTTSRLSANTTAERTASVLDNWAYLSLHWLSRRLFVLVVIGGLAMWLTRRKRRTNYEASSRSGVRGGGHSWWKRADSGPQSATEKVFFEGAYPERSDLIGATYGMEHKAVQSRARALLTQDPFPETINTMRPSCQTILMEVAYHGFVDEVKSLLAAGAEPNVATESLKLTALHLACVGRVKQPDCYSFAPICRLLIEAGADINLQDYAGRSALHKAMCVGASHLCQPDIVSILIESGADVDAKDDDGNLPRTGAGYGIDYLAATGQLSAAARARIDLANVDRPTQPEPARQRRPPVSASESDKFFSGTSFSASRQGTVEQYISLGNREHRVLGEAPHT